MGDARDTFAVIDDLTPKVEITLDVAERFAARAAIDTWVTNDTKVIGIGSGKTCQYAIQRIAERVWNEGDLCNIVCIPSSFSSSNLILENGLRLGHLSRYPRVDVTFDGADEIDQNLSLIKGGGGNMLQEKIVSSCSKDVIIIADYAKFARKLGDRYFNGIPIEISPVAFIPIMRRIEKMHGGQCELRSAKAKLGPIVTDNGNFLVDWRFQRDREYNWAQVNYSIKLIPGVMETGLFVDMIQMVYFGMEDGSVTVKTRDA